MTTVHDHVKDIMVNYNSTFNTRWRILHHVFFVIGTGCNWSGRSIYCHAHNPDRQWKKSRESELSVDDFMVFFDKEQERIKNTSYLTPKDPAVVDLQRKFAAFHANFLVNNIDDLVDNNITLNDSQLPKNSEINGGNALFWYPPEQIDDDWRAALVEAGTIMLGLIRNYYAQGDDSENAIWSCTKTKNFYFKMKEHIELVKTKQYKYSPPKKTKKG